VICSLRRSQFIVIYKYLSDIFITISELLMFMGKLKNIAGFLRVFWKQAKEDWEEMDHKLIRIIVTAITFAAAALFWLYFFKNSSPFGF